MKLRDKADHFSESLRIRVVGIIDDDEPLAEFHDDAAHLLRLHLGEGIASVLLDGWNITARPEKRRPRKRLTFRLRIADVGGRDALQRAAANGPVTPEEAASIRKRFRHPIIARSKNGLREGFRFPAILNRFA